MMVIVRKSNLRRRAEQSGSSIRRDVGAGSRLGDVVRQVLEGSGGSQPRFVSELDDLPMPDLLDPHGRSNPDPESLLNHLDLAFLGRASAGELDAALDAMPAGASTWSPSSFAGDLFVGHLVKTCLKVHLRGRPYPVHREFLERVLTHPPMNRDVIQFRQAILDDLQRTPPLRQATEDLLGRLFHLLSLLRASRDDARLEPVRFRLDVLRALRTVVDLMAESFATADSGLRRLYESASTIRRSEAYRRMTDLIDHQNAMASLDLEVVVGADGRLRHLEIRGLKEIKGNPFFRRPLRRWWDRLRIFYHRYTLDADTLVDTLVMGVYQEIAPALARLMQCVCHLEVYLSALGFADEARRRGLEVCLPELATSSRLVLDNLFNPLLLAQTDQPVPSDIRLDPDQAVALVTGPNSGGKTRLLQAVGINQILGQSGLFVPAARAVIPVVDGLFASIIEFDQAEQSEGRLGTELVRLRSLFETAPRGSLVLLDELCSGTNPSEAIEIFEMVLDLLRQLEPVALVTTHFLDFAQEMHNKGARKELLFLQAEVHNEHGATYRFIDGVAKTSLAVGTAHRLGMTFDDIAKRLGQRLDDE